jgi:SAM-dependent methyltransferase
MAQAEAIFYDTEAAERPADRWSHEVGRLFLDWMAVPPGQRWLDLGCGDGAFTEVLIARCAPSAVSAMDLPQPQIHDARSFDAAVMAQAISFVPDPAGAVAQMARVVRPGGWVGAYMWDFMGGGAPDYLISAGAKDLGIIFARPGGAEVSRLHILRDLWRATGLVHVEPRTIRMRVRYDGFDDFWGSCQNGGATGMAIEALSPQMRARLQDHLRASLPTGPYGRIDVPVWANAVKGRVAEPAT